MNWQQRFAAWLRGPRWDPYYPFHKNVAMRLSFRPSKPEWDPTLKRLETQWRFYVVLLSVLVITLLVLSWVLMQPIEAATPRAIPAGVDLAVVLAPVLAAAAGIERFLETLFYTVEGYARTLVAYLGRGMRWLKNAETEVDSARAWLATVSAEYTRQLQSLPSFSPAPPAAAPSGAAAPAPLDPVKEAEQKLVDAKKLMALAEQRLATAETQLSQVTDSSGYKNAKRAATIYLGLLLGLIVATASSLQMFAMMGVKVGSARVDVLITGLVIGSGSAPVHSLINILQSAKDTLDSAQDFMDARKAPPAKKE